MGLLDKIINDTKQSKAKKNASANPDDKTMPLVTGDLYIDPQFDKTKKDAVYIPEYMTEAPLHMDASIYDVMNTYRGTFPEVVAQMSGHADDNGNFPYYKTIVSPSLFNPYYGVTASGISPGVPLLDNTTNGQAISASGFGKIKGLDTASIKLNEINDCSINNLVALSNEDDSILGQARYKYADFMYCRDVGKISNNHMITLRRFSAPVPDNIYQHTPKPDTTNGAASIEVAGDIGRLITWFGTAENKLEDILKYSFHASWREMDAAIQQEDSKENDPRRGITGALVNLFNTKHAQAADKGTSESALKLLLGDDASDFDTAPYADNPAVNGRTFDNHRIYEPKDSIRSVNEYEGKLMFNHSFTLTFNYKLRSYDNINGKSAFLDLLSNILAVTYKKGFFWPGEQHIIGAPANISGWQKALKIQDNIISDTGTFLDKLITGKSFSDIASSFMNLIGGTGVDKVFKDPQNTAKDILKKLQSSGVQNIFTGLMKNAMGRPAKYAFDSLLNQGLTGMWHVTIGNPLNPIASIGNLIIDGDVEISHSGPLGLDDFPTEITVKVPLKHAMPRDMVDIQRMYTKGHKGIYAAINPEKMKMTSTGASTASNSEGESKKLSKIKKEKNETPEQKKARKANNREYRKQQREERIERGKRFSPDYSIINVSAATTNGTHKNTGYFADFDTSRIQRISDSLREIGPTKSNTGAQIVSK
jgi:hypothetical protein